MGKTLLVKSIAHLVTCDSKDRVLDGVNLFVKDGVIAYIGSKLMEADEVLDGSKLLVYPGLVNTHHHLYQTFTRNLPQVQKMELFDWLKLLYSIWENLDENTVMYSSLTGMGELMKCGCTTCMDHHYVFPKKAGSYLIDRQFEAAKQLGIRMFAARGSMDLSVKDGGLPPDSVVQDIEEILKDSLRLVKEYHDPSPFSMRQVGLAPCSPFSASSDLMKESKDLARSLGVRLHTHLAETKDEEAYTLSRFGMRPLAYAKSLGFIGEDVWFAHGIHFNEEELELLAHTKTGVAHCPISNMKLSSGVAHIPKMLHLGVPVGLAVDGSASNDGSNLLEEIRVAYLLHRLYQKEDAPEGYEFLKMATRGSASLLGRTDIGCLEVGKAADFFAVNKSRLELVGTQMDPKSLFATVGFKGSVDLTVVNGCITVRDGRLVLVDEEKIQAESELVFQSFIKSKN